MSNAKSRGVAARPVQIGSSFSQLEEGGSRNGRKSGTLPAPLPPRSGDGPFTIRFADLHDRAMQTSGLLSAIYALASRLRATGWRLEQRRRPGFGKGSRSPWPNDGCVRTRRRCARPPNGAAATTKPFVSSLVDPPPPGSQAQKKRPPLPTAARNLPGRCMPQSAPDQFAPKEARGICCFLFFSGPARPRRGAWIAAEWITTASAALRCVRGRDLRPSPDLPASVTHLVVQYRPLLCRMNRFAVEEPPARGWHSTAHPRATPYAARPRRFPDAITLKTCEGCCLTARAGRNLSRGR